MPPKQLSREDAISKACLLKGERDSLKGKLTKSVDSGGRVGDETKAHKAELMRDLSQKDTEFRNFLLNNRLKESDLQ